MIALAIISSFILAYLMGNILFAQIIGIYFLKTNLRTVGSGNVGATNLTRAGGKWIGIVGTILDSSKGFLAIVFANLIIHATVDSAGSSNDYIYIASFACSIFVILGHCYPILFFVSWARTKSYVQAKRHMGGKAVATTGGCLFAFSPWIALISFGTWWVFLYLTRYVSVSSMVCLFVAPWLMLIKPLDLYWLFPFRDDVSDLNMSFQFAVCFIFLFNWAIVVFRHKSNIGKLINGTESKVKMFSKGR